MTRPQSVHELRADGKETVEAQDTERHYTSTIERVDGEGREIYIYLDHSDSLEWKDEPSGGKSSYMSVHVDMNGHRHWNVHLAPHDKLETGRILPPPPPPPPPNGGG